MVTFHFVKRNLFTVLAFAHFMSGQALAITTEEIQQWTHPRLHKREILEKIKFNIENEVNAPTLRDSQEPHCPTFGLSFAGVSSIATQCLKEIYIRSQASLDHPPAVADIGAGYGYMTWKLMLAGGQVDSVEGQKKTAEKIRFQVMLTKDLLGAGVNVKERVKIFPNDFFSYSRLESIKDKYDVTWSGNILHMLTPENLRIYLSQLYSITKPGGKAFVVADAPSSRNTTAKDVAFTNDLWTVDRFLENKKSEMLFPGYLAINLLQISDLIFGTLVRTTQKIQGAVAINLKSEDRPIPSTTYKNYYPVTEPFAHTSLDLGLPHQQVEIPGHYVVHLLDHEVLKREFEAVGFVIEDIYYVNSKSSRIEELPSKEDLQAAPCKIELRAIKPRI